MRTLGLLIASSWVLTGCSLALNPEIPTDGGSGRSCSANADCAGAGSPEVCGPAGRCVSALTQACSKTVGGEIRAGTVVLGSILPTGGDFTSIGLPIEQAMELAVVEINESGGLPGGRNIVVVECDTAGSGEQGAAAAEHLIDTVGVPVIIGPAFSGIFIDVTTQLASQAGVMTISPSATSPTITGLEDDGLGWRTAASDAFQGVAISDLVRLRGYDSVIALGKDDAYGRGLLESLNQTIGIDLGEDNYYSRTYPDPGTTMAPDYASAIIDALDTIPDTDVIVLFGTPETAELLNLFEQRIIDTSTTASSNMQYVMVDGGRADETVTLAMNNPDLLDRIEGTEADHKNGTLFDIFSLRFQQRYGSPPGIYNSNAYDAMYLVAYAMMTLGSGDISGTSVASAMQRLVDGQKIEAGPGDIATARNALESGGTIDFEGASGPLDFNLQTGEAGANVARWVVERRPNGEFRIINSGTYAIDSTGSGTWDLTP